MRQIEKLNTDLFNENISFVSLGKLSPEMVAFISARVPSLQNILSPDKDILFWKDRISHIEKHRNEFMSDIDNFLKKNTAWKYE